jgi:hypothetical protein
MKEEVEVADVAAIVKGGNEYLVLFRRTVYLKPVDGSIEGGADKLRSFSFRSFALRAVRRKIEKMLSAIGIPQRFGLLSIHRDGNLDRRINCIQIASQWHRDPIIAVDFVITADNAANLAIVAGAEYSRGIGADVIEIDCGVPGWIHRAECPIGLFH